MEILPIILTLIAGFSTILGLVFTYISTKKADRVVSLCLSFSVGMILSICLLDLIPHSTLVLYKESSSGVVTFIYLILFFYLVIF